jgi:hypothetical protein
MIYSTQDEPKWGVNLEMEDAAIRLILLWFVNHVCDEIESYDSYKWLLKEFANYLFMEFQGHGTPRKFANSDEVIEFLENKRALDTP